MVERNTSSLRRRILTFVGGLILVSLLGSVVSLYRITEVNQVLGTINRGAIPLSKLITQMAADAEILQRELDRGLGASHWNDPQWKPRPVPRWIEDVLQSELNRLETTLTSGLPDLDPEARARWTRWSEDVAQGLGLLRSEAHALHQALVLKDESQAAQIYPRWDSALQEWRRLLTWGVSESDRSLRADFGLAQGRVSSLRTALEVVLLVIISLSCLLLWLGERALRPLGELTRWVRSVTQRGELRREDKAGLPEMSLGRSDEVSELGREFHRMATALLEREKTLELQQRRLKESEHLAAIGRMSAQVAHEVRNPLHSIGLEAEVALDLATKGSQGVIPLKQSLQSILASVERLEKITENYLKLSKPAAPTRDRVDLRTLAEDVLATYAPQCEALAVSVDWTLEERRPLEVAADREQLEQVLGNLVRNAIQALESRPEPRRLRLALGAAESGRAWIRIEDNGPGVSAEIRDRLFTPFVTTKAQGTGLGLSFAKKVTEELGGEIRLEDREATGASFLITLPQLSALTAPPALPEALIVEKRHG